MGTHAAPHRAIHLTTMTLYIIDGSQLHRHIVNISYIKLEVRVVYQQHTIPATPLPGSTIVAGWDTAYLLQQ